VAVAVALACKEDAALAIFVLGFVVWLKHHERARGLATSALGAGWFLLCAKVIIPLANGGKAPFYTDLFPGLGTSVTSIIYNVVRHPSRWLTPATAHSRWTYYAQLFWPVGLIALAELPVLAIGGPQLLINVISGHGYTRDIQYHYSSIVVAGIFLATVEACAHRGRTMPGRRFLVGLLLASSLAANVAWSPSPLSVHFHSGIWAKPVPKHQAMNAAVRMIPTGASVSATYILDDHLTHRTLIYEWPNPWITSNWGVGDTHPADPARVDWIVLDTTLNGNSRALYDALVAHEFSIVFYRSGIVVAHRVAPGIPNDHTWPHT
jgi:uncharacterized membrane protein